MVSLMLERFGGDRRGASSNNATPPAAHSAEFPDISCYHVNTRFSQDIADLGVLRPGKFFLVFRYCFEAIWCRIRYGVDTFYFAPAPPKLPALYRDLLVMCICRPFFRNFIHHWHAVGLADWLREHGNVITRTLTRWLMGKPALGLALARANLHDPLWLEARRVEIVPNGIPDPFPTFDTTIRPRRAARLEARRALLRHNVLTSADHSKAGDDPHVFKVLYLGYCFREKGIFETVEGVVRAQSMLRSQGHGLTIHLTVAGEFPRVADREELDALLTQQHLQDAVHFAGFVQGEEKNRLLTASDCLCFPTYYPLESFGLVVLEAMAAGMNVISTNWRALPEILPADHVGFVPVRDPEAVAQAICQLLTHDAAPLRARFLERFTADSHLRKLYRALLSAENPVGETSRLTI